MNPSERCNTINGITITNVVALNALPGHHGSTSLCHMTVHCQGNLVGVLYYVSDTSSNIPMSVFAPEKGKPCCERLQLQMR